MKRALVLAIVSISAPAWAHKPSDAHVQLAVSGDHVSGTLAVALRDLDGALDLDANGDGNITWGEALAAAPRIEAYAQERLVIADCTLAFGAGKLVDFSDGAYWTMPITGGCDGAPATLTVTYKLLFDIDAQHRGIIHVQSARAAVTAVVRDARPIAVDLGASSPGALAAAGATRTWTSVAQLLLLACLILPVMRSRRAVHDVIAIYGAFALASTATLLLSVAELIYLPSEVVAYGVPVALALAAVANLLRVARGRRDLAFELGLLHGLASAPWLRAATHGLVPALGFAIGSTVAGASFVALVAAVLFSIRRTFAYHTLVWAGSALTALGVVAWAWLG